MPTPVIDNMPPAPSPTDSRAEFSTKTFNFYAAMAGFIMQMNAAIAWIVAQLATIAGYVSTTTDARDQANAAAAAAAASSTAVKWVSGTSYAQGVVVWSPGTWQSYRRKVAGAGTLQPENDPANWALQVPATLDATVQAALDRQRTVVGKPATLQTGAQHVEWIDASNPWQPNLPLKAVTQPGDTIDIVLHINSRAGGNLTIKRQEAGTYIGGIGASLDENLSINVDLSRLQLTCTSVSAGNVYWSVTAS